MTIHEVMQAPPPEKAICAECGRYGDYKLHGGFGRGRLIRLCIECYPNRNARKG